MVKFFFGQEVPFSMTQDPRRFTTINEAFICDYCEREVPQAQKSCRNHCPFCLCSKHVDVNPGDRAETCHGRLRAVDYDLTGKKGLVLIHRCDKCGVEVRNKAALGDAEAPDNYDLILKLKPGVR